ncbi:hemerythrin domain-containing protein [Ottowia sp.]|uniref:hemerythrin domain-containing protein n=1 Tax=Ottowia sp. TaxID=1898956 RepID=UPI001E0997BF|nr:hemerythrin domain-containing protein [Ottowia sp.]MCP5259546.1 hemerythrin domain-containing protein [Burkholderiaceae bacterium]MCB2024371.1 hemerythrin domain-containing protein [Ottowia sp.]MCB2033562.1 hemerythrin domain-containing protein [Ottowia sp.]MCB2037597.1 hemerythrin domain-containing protein [Ottowia sp.]HPK30963.1 hemerythrin domain-containing protein [Ottowia sp.]
MKHRSLEIIRDEHSSLAAMLQSMRMLVARGPRDNPKNFFDVLRAMLFYIDEFPERLHHPKETELLFPRVLKAVPELGVAVARLDRDHEYTEKAVRDIQHLLLGWELLGESRRETFTDAFDRYVNLYLAHMQLEEKEVLPAAEKHLTEEDWQAVDAAFEKNCDPLTGKFKPEPMYDRLFTRIVQNAPAPIGLGQG